MKNRYDSVMENIYVTEEMHDRIIENISNSDLGARPQKVMSIVKYKNIVAIAACFVLLFVGVITIPILMKTNDEPIVETAPGITEYKTVGELSKAVGFDMKEIQDIPFEVEQIVYTAYGHDLAEITYVNKDYTVSFRKSAGSEDNSGDYNEYTSIKDIAINDHTVTIKGDKDLYSLAIWENDGYAYSIYSSVGISETELIDMVKSVQ
ncbi:MAG TPA: DUF4367 domain-containing protein [Lachnospiraceae bacterium]|nr:DUF4367 domain-containing protein [Lachnospiraceae bacterium]